MVDLNIEQLKCAVEEMYDGQAVFVESVVVHEKNNSETIWYGPVHVFDLMENPRVRRVYAWSHEVLGGERRTFAIPQGAGIGKPEEAVREGICQEKRMARFGREPTRR